MLTTLIRRELLDNLMTFRFAAAVLIMLLLVVATTAVLIRDYERRLASYNAAVKKNRQKTLERTTYSGARLTIDRPPNPLSIFSVGLDKRLGNTLRVNHLFVPTLWDAGKHGGDNPFLNLFSSIDLVFIFQGILSLLALVFAYDTLAGERERGTLRLVLTHPVRRGQVLKEVDRKTLTAKSAFFTEKAEMIEHLNQEYLTSQMAQVQHAQSITRVSPATLLQHLLESFAGTGFARHWQFVDNVERYARQYREFVVDIDRSDPKSFHIICVREGMTEKKVLPAAVPKFEDTLSLSKDFNDSAMEILLLTMFVVLLLSGTYLAFVRVEV